jgi:hypothetical protein
MRAWGIFLDVNQNMVSMPKPMTRKTANMSRAHLSSYTIAREIYPSPEFVDDQNLTATRQAWEALSGDPGVVALTNGYVEEHHLPTAMRYPWDHSKGVYLLQGFHNLHCIVG